MASGIVRGAISTVLEDKILTIQSQNAELMLNCGNKLLQSVIENEENMEVITSLSQPKKHDFGVYFTKEDLMPCQNCGMSY